MVTASSPKILQELAQHDDIMLVEDTGRKCCVCSAHCKQSSNRHRWLGRIFPRRKLSSSKRHRRSCNGCDSYCCLASSRSNNKKCPVVGAKRVYSSYAKTVTVHSPCQTQNVYTDFSSDHLRHSLNKDMEHLSITGRIVDPRLLRCFSRITLDCLTHLTLTGNQLYRYPRRVRLLLTTLPTQSLRHLNLSWNGLDHEAIALFGRRGLQHMNHLLSIRLCGNQIGAKGLRVLIEEGNLQRVPAIDLWDCELGDEGVTILAQAMVRADARVERLVLDMNGIGNKGVKELALGMVHCPSLVALDLCCNNIDHQGIRALAPALLCSNVTQLNLRANRVGPAGALILADVLNDTCLKRLMLCHNGIGDEGVQHLTTALGAQEGQGYAVSTRTTTILPRLQELSLSFNFLSIKSAKALAKALATNTTLKRLFLHGNMIDRRGAMPFCQVLQTANQSLLQLTILDPSYENHLVQEKLDMYLGANASGRRHWGDLSIPLTAWTRKLSEMTPDFLFSFLNSRPDIAASCHRHSNCY